MSHFSSLLEFFSLVFIAQSVVVAVILSASILFFLVLLILGIKKIYLLRKENNKLNQKFKTDSLEDNKTYTDFTEGHIYENF
ncbi:MAG: hypothetical protein ABI295_04065 [Xanthomarina sp.]